MTNFDPIRFRFHFTEFPLLRIDPVRCHLLIRMIVCLSVECTARRRVGIPKVPKFSGWSVLFLLDMFLFLLDMCDPVLTRSVDLYSPTPKSLL